MCLYARGDAVRERGMDGTTEPGEGRDRELGVFLPMLHERVARAIATGQRFVHYTGAPAAMSMIRSGELWLRNTQCMNDFSEVRYGLDMLDAVYNSDDGRRLIDFVESVHPGIRAAVRERVAGLGDTIAYGTYIACVSEHDPAEDGIGRLSMWRAYSGASGVALVLRNPILVGPGSDQLGVFTGPVVYDGRDAFVARFARFVEGILRERRLSRAHRTCAHRADADRQLSLRGARDQASGLRRGARVAHRVHAVAAARRRADPRGRGLPRRAADRPQAAAAWRARGRTGPAPRSPTSSTR